MHAEVRRIGGDRVGGKPTNISMTCTASRRSAAGCDSASPMKKVHRAGDVLRPPLGGSRGFTLIELMVTVAVLSVLAAAALAGYRQDQYRGQYKRFVDDARGALVTARNAAIDDQTLVQVVVQSDELQVNRFNQATGVWEPLSRAGLDSARANLVENDNNVCVYGLISGVQTPRQAEDSTPPAGCLAGPQTIQFEPDGSFTDPDNTFTTLDNVGATLWIANQQISGNTKLAMIQIFPGGLIRAFDKTEDAS